MIFLKFLLLKWKNKSGNCEPTFTKLASSNLESKPQM